MQTNAEKVLSRRFRKDVMLAPQVVMSTHYSELYANGVKHDSPDQSRTSMVRRVINATTAGLPNNLILDIGSGPQGIFRQCINNIGRRAAQKFVFASIDHAVISRKKLLTSESSRTSHFQADAAKLPFKNGVFGLVLSNHAIDFCGEWGIAEAARVIHPDGIALFYFHHADMIPSDFTGIVIHPRTKRFWEYLARENVLFDNEGRIEDVLAKNGFTSAEIKLNHDDNDKWWEVVAKKAA